MIRVKICGVNAPDAFDAAVAAGADWVGFVFFARSPRYVTPAMAANLSARHKGGPKRVGLFVDATSADIDAALDALALDAFQLNGPTHRRPGVETWHAHGVATRADLPASTDADALVIESRPPIGATRPGGNATSFDWTLTAGWSPPAPWLLAGGLTPENVARAIAISGAAAVDVSSGVESAPGVKVPARIAAFIQAARAADIGA